uniref:Uncharacterized protein n=1 Tax=Arundo donax TaxID=35708 RepID=A0A0A9M1A4_ARUDO
MSPRARHRCCSVVRGAMPLSASPSMSTRGSSRRRRRGGRKTGPLQRRS